MGRRQRAAGGGERAALADNESCAACECELSCEHCPGNGGECIQGAPSPGTPGGGAEVAERLTWQATHTHPSAKHFPPPQFTHALTGVVLGGVGTGGVGCAQPLRVGRSSPGSMHPQNKG